MSNAVDSFGTSYSLQKVNENNPVVFIHGVGLNKEIWTPQINFEEGLLDVKKWLLSGCVVQVE